ncbi:MAG: ATP-binding protein [Planctomycetota bacterium]
MKGKDSQLEGAAELRRQAEKTFREKAALSLENPEALSPEEMRQTLHELHVHQIELEMQNEELRRARAELDASWARYFDLYDRAPVGYFSLSQQGLILEANLSAADLLGVARNTLAKRPITRFILEEDRDIYYRHHKQLSETLEPQVCELRMLRTDAAPFWARFEATAVKNGESGEQVFRVVVSDITERKQAAEALQLLNRDLEWRVAQQTAEIRKTCEAARAEWQRLYDLLEMLPVYLMLLTADYQVPFANRTFRERFGESRGRFCFEYLFQRTKPCENCETQKVLKTGVPHRWEWTAPDGRHYDTQGFPFVDADGSTLVLEMGIDITEQRRTEENSQQMKAELAHLDRTACMAELTASLAHEINQPLTAILSNAQAARRMLASDAPDPEMFREILDDIIRDDKRAGSVIHHLRLMLQKGKQEPEWFDVNRAVREVVQLLHGEIIGHGVAISMDLDPTRGGCCVLANRIEVQQVLVNLLLNALHAVRGLPSDRRKVLIGTRHDAEAFVVAIRDRGCGIQLPDVNGIFEPFFTTKPTGFGMGLAICRRMLQGHGGRIWAKNNEDAGVTVSFSLPVPRVPQESSDG